MMKAIAVLMSGLVACGAVAGPIDPPFGPVGPTMKPLDHVEPRTAIGPETTPGDADSVYRITEPGSYYLTADVLGEAGKHGIEVHASDVTIDLMGFTVAGVSSGLDGVHGDTASNIVVRNGAVRGWGGDGVDLRQVTQARIERVQVSGAGFQGIVVGEGSLVISSTAFDNARNGIELAKGSVVQGCLSQGNMTGILALGEATISGCTVRLNSGTGINAAGSNTIFDCGVLKNGGNGIVCSGGYISRCNVSENSGNGIDVTSEASVVDNHCTSNGQAGVNARSRRNRIERNFVTDNVTGIKTNDWHNFVASNIATMNGTAYDLSDGGLAGQTLLGTGTVTTGNSWANLGF